MSDILFVVYFYGVLIGMFALILDWNNECVIPSLNYENKLILNLLPLIGYLYAYQLIKKIFFNRNKDK